MKMSLFGMKEKREIARLRKQLKIREEIDENQKKIIENNNGTIEDQTKIIEIQDDRIIVLKKKLEDERDTHEWKAELLRQMLIYKNKKIEELIKSKNQLRKEEVRLEDRVEELQQELLNERERADRYADACSASMEYGWQPVPEEEMEKAGFTKTETGWRA